MVPGSHNNGAMHMMGSEDGRAELRVFFSAFRVRFPKERASGDTRIDGPAPLGSRIRITQQDFARDAISKKPERPVNSRGDFTAKHNNDISFVNRPVQAERSPR